MPGYTNVAKPTGANYTRITFSGKYIYDDLLTYDQSDIFYDGIDQAAYTNISKPTGSSYTNIPKPT